MGKKPLNEGYQPGKGNFGYKPCSGNSEYQNSYQPTTQTSKPSNPPSGGSSANPPKK